MLLAAEAGAQTWCPPGAEWHYDFHSVSSVAGYERVTYIGDTMINGVECQKLKRVMHAVDQSAGTPVSVDHPDLFTRYADDLVAIQVEEGFDTLWYYGAGPGDTWRVPIPGWATTPLITVMDTGSVIVDAVPLRWWSIEVSDQPWGEVLVDTIIERVGALRIFMLPGASYLMEDHTGPLRCYTDNELQYTHGNSTDCDALVSVDELPSPMRAELFPQPSSGLLTLSCRGLMRPSEMVVWDASGREVARRHGLNDASIVDLRELNSGIYHYGLFIKGASVPSSGWLIITQ